MRDREANTHLLIVYRLVCVCSTVWLRIDYSSHLGSDLFGWRAAFSCIFPSHSLRNRSASCAINSNNQTPNKQAKEEEKKKQSNCLLYFPPTLFSSSKYLCLFRARHEKHINVHKINVQQVISNQLLGSVIIKKKEDRKRSKGCVPWTKDGLEWNGM